MYSVLETRGSRMSKRETAKRRSRVLRDALTCKPLETIEEIRMFLDNPPPWRTLCKEFTPHSKFVIRNIEHKESCEPELELPETYCHFDPDAEAPIRYDVTVKKLPKTLVCHDLANGYHDDSKIEGSQTYDAYTFYNWAGIDIFCYFSHHLITIPPVSWICTGHAHGVKVIGTIITEWAEGTQLWDRILSSEASYRDFASAVVAIAKTMKFDGWLLNIENKISNPELLLDFIRYLHKILHEELKDPVLIWYDSVTITGNLNWQNGLNAKNKAFFDICDGFFTNYSWTLKDVDETVKAAGDRVADVYIGIDVWGRNFYGGGQFNVQAAVKVAHEAGCSLAIFAPAWTHEAINEAKGTSLTMANAHTIFEQFVLRDRALWGSIWPYLNTHLPCQLPFQTSFCRGMGKKRWMYGEVISPGPWYNLRHQQYQPNSAHGPHGYVLSSMDKLLKASWIRHDNKGIIKYRKDLDALRSLAPEDSLPENNSSAGKDDQEAENKNDESAEDSSDEVLSLQTKGSIMKFESMNENSSNKRDPGTVTQDSREKNNVKFQSSSSQTNRSGFKKFLNKIKSIFKHSETKLITVQASSSTVGETSAQPKELHKELQAGQDMATSGSMVDVSVNLNLHVDKGKARWALGQVTMERECLNFCIDDAFNGGACLKINPSDKISTEHRTIRLFHCDFQCQDTLIICVVTKVVVQYADQVLNIKLSMKNAIGHDLTVILMGKSLGIRGSLTKDSEGIVYCYPINSEKQEAFRNLREYLLLNEPDFYVPLDNLYGWSVRYHEVHVPGSRLLEVNCRTVLPEGGIYLGHFGMCHRPAHVVDKRTAT